MFRNFVTIILVVGFIIVIASNAESIWQWTKNTFKSDSAHIVSSVNDKSATDDKITQDKESDIQHAENKDIISEKNEINAEKIDEKIEGENLQELSSSESPQDMVDNEDIEVTDAPEDHPVEQVVSGIVSKGDTIIELLNPYDNPNRVKQFLDAAEDVFSPRKFRIGQPYTITYNTETDSIKSFTYEIDKFKILIIEGENPKAKVEEIVYEKSLILVENTIEDNLFLAVTSIGESANLAMRIADIFAWEVNFIRDIQKNDSFSILVEKLYRDNEFKGYGKTLGATFSNKGKKYSAYLYRDAKKIEGYYSDKGESLKKVLLQSPLSFTRVTSGYTKSRKHPIFGTYRPHLGIDYGAPTGTPVMAVGDGTVKVRGWVGGYGYQVVISHTSGFESMYSHLSRFPKNVRKGTRVRQGQTIGYVGSTGISTGPHLDFRLKRHGKFINPSSAMSPRSDPIAKKNMPAFEKWKLVVNDFMNKNRPLSEYKPDLFNMSK